MAFPVRIRLKAEIEVADTIRWYDGRAPGLGATFLETFESVVEAISKSPELYAKVRGEARRVVFRRFPYALFYVFTGSEVVVLACLHERRSPERWPG